MNITPELQMRFREYLREVPQAKQHLEFLLGNLGLKVELDYSRESLEALESAFWSAHKTGIPDDLSDESQFAKLITQYLADAIIRRTVAKWVQLTDRNPMFGQPALDNFGNEKWDRVYPVALADNFVNLRRTNPSFPGVLDQKVLVRLFDKVIAINEAATGSEN